MKYYILLLLCLNQLFAQGNTIFLTDVKYSVTRDAVFNKNFIDKLGYKYMPDETIENLGFTDQCNFSLLGDKASVKLRKFNNKGVMYKNISIIKRGDKIACLDKVSGLLCVGTEDMLDDGDSITPECEDIDPIIMPFSIGYMNYKDSPVASFPQLNSFEVTEGVEAIYKLYKSNIRSDDTSSFDIASSSGDKWSFFFEKGKSFYPSRWMIASKSFNGASVKAKVTSWNGNIPHKIVVQHYLENTLARSDTYEIKDFLYNYNNKNDFSFRNLINSSSEIMFLDSDQIVPTKK